LAAQSARDGSVIPLTAASLANRELALARLARCAAALLLLRAAAHRRSPRASNGLAYKIVGIGVLPDCY
jgi:hypothetical protein